MGDRSSKHRFATVSYAEAAAQVQSYAERLHPAGGSAELGLLEALNRVLAEPIVADRDQPPFDRSTRDGFACKAASAASPMRVVGSLKAGERWAGPPLASGQAIEIMTGAPVPDGADCVVMIEHVEHGERFEHVAAEWIGLLPGRQIKAGDNVVPSGAEARAGSILVPAGTRLGPSQLAAAASVGASRLRVHARPRVAILATGDELVGVEDVPLPYQIRNSNSYVLAAMVQALGGEPILSAPVADTTEALERAVQAAIDTKEGACDLLLLTGGVSMGKYDLVEGALARLGAEFFFTGVRMQPGKPVVFGDLPRITAGIYARIPWFGLPGNPVSTMVTFALFAAPILAALGGERGYRPGFAEARLRSSVEGKPGLRRFLPSLLSADADRAEVDVVPWQGSGDVAGAAVANCLLVVPEGAALAAGASVRVLLL